ncbi:MAG TPA: hypothetical protein DEQ47_13790 [Solibacterales bacterium]|nr:hypothetical protein [Bryobacterales bacterium]
MASLSLKTLLNPRSGAAATVASLLDALGGSVSVQDMSGARLLGALDGHAGRMPVWFADVQLGWVTGRPEAAGAVCSLLTHLAAREAEKRALAAEVLHLYREVHLIEQLSEQLTALFDIATVGRSALEQARRLIAASDGCVLVRDTDGGQLSEVASFGDGESPLPCLSPLASAILERGVAGIVNDAGAQPSSREFPLLYAPLRSGRRTVGIVALGNAAGTPYTSADLKLLNTIALQTAAAIENAILCVEMVGAARDREQLAALQKELDTARMIQHSLVPRVFPPFPERTDFDLHAQMTSARAVGGDFFDFFLIDDDRLAVVIGDVSGKGVPAALYMAAVRTHIKIAAIKSITPEECLQAVNRVLVREQVSSMFATCFYGILDTRNGELRYCNAGHNPPWVLRAGGAMESLTDAGGIPLGLMERMPYTGGVLPMGAGDALFLYTDGVPEASNAGLDDFSDERLALTLRDGARLDCRGLVDLVTQELVTFTAGAQPSDDITMLMVRRTAENHPR